MRFFVVAAVLALTQGLKLVQEPAPADPKEAAVADAEKAVAEEKEANAGKTDGELRQEQEAKDKAAADDQAVAESTLNEEEAKFCSELKAARDAKANHVYTDEGSVAHELETKSVTTNGFEVESVTFPEEKAALAADKEVVEAAAKAAEADPAAEEAPAAEAPDAAAASLAQKHGMNLAQMKAKCEL